MKTAVATEEHDPRVAILRLIVGRIVQLLTRELGSNGEVSSL